MALPLSKIFTLSISRGQKVLLALLFTMGIFYTALEIARLLYVQLSSYEIVTVRTTMLFNPIQASTALVVTCAPILRPLFVRTKRLVQGGSNTTPNGSRRSWVRGSKSEKSSGKGSACVGSNGHAAEEMARVGEEGQLVPPVVESQLSPSIHSMDFVSVNESRRNSRRESLESSVT